MTKIISILVFVCLFASSYSQTQGNLLTITSNVPPSLTICGATKIFSLNLNNPTPFSLQNGTVSIVIPVGMNYQAGSIVGATPISVTTNTLVFSIVDLASLTQLDISFIGYADCDVISFLSSGNSPKNTVKVDYFKGGTLYYDSHITNDYLIKQPNLSITNITNQTYTGAVNDVFTRCIKIVNGGLGELSQFTLTDNHATGLQITSVSNGSWTNTNAGLETIILNSTDFNLIGDNDGLFETGESITICEVIKINNCIGANSDYKAFWGCNGKQCQYSQSSGNVVFPGLVPNISVVPNKGNITADMNSCFGAGNASQQELKIYNSGTGVAYNVKLDVYQATSTGGYNPNVGSYIDVNSITSQLFASGSPTALVPTSTQLTNQLNCMPANSMGEFKITIPTIAPGDTLYVRWNTYSCCYNYCTGVGQTYFNGWSYQGDYENICQSSYPIVANWGRIYSQGYLSMTNDNSPATLNTGETGTFVFNLSAYGMHYNVPNSPSSQWFVTYTVSPCLSYAGNFKLLAPNGTSTYSVPSSVTVVGNVITATFNGYPPPSYALQGGAISIDLLLNCSGCVSTSTANPNCGGSSIGNNNVACEITYMPNASCACKITLGCFSVPISFNCPGNCPEGMIFKKFISQRVNYGKPDNEANGGDGQPDGVGSLDFTKIRRDRATFHDTIASTFTGTIKTSVSFPSWQFCYAKSSIGNGDKLSFVNASVKIYRAGSLLATSPVTSPTVSTSGTTRDFYFDLSVVPLASSLPVGFVYQNNDSVVFVPRYVMTGNIPGAVVPCSFSNEYYVSPIPTPTVCTDKYQCNTQSGNINLVGYYFENWNTESYLGSACNTISFYQHYTMQLGPWFNPYSNWFPNEYRNWDHMKNMQIAIPTGYEFISATIVDYRNAGSGIASVASATIAPLSVATNTLVFNNEALYQGYGGTLPLKDDGGYGYINMILRPSCAVAQDIRQPIVYTWNYEPVTQFTGVGSYPNVLQSAYHCDTVRYDGPDLKLQSNLITVNVPNDTTAWTLNLSNSSNVPASNVWISAPTISGVSAIRFYDLTSNTLIVPVNGIYQLGTLNAASSKNYLLVANFTSCNPDSIIVYAGWNCIGYPTSLSAYPCTPVKLTLKEIPLFPNIITSAQGPSGTIALCDTATYVVTMENVQLGTAYNSVLSAILPIGVTIIPGSSYLAYPTTTSFVSTPDPTFVSGTQYKWNVSTLNAILNTNGLKGVTETGFNKITIRFKVIAGCGYTSGSTINFQTKANAACGALTGDELSLSTNLSITGANAPYNTDIKMRTTFISPCNFSTPMQIAIKNVGPSNTQPTDSVIIELPKGVSYVAGSFVGNTNAPTNTVPSQYLLNNITYLKWKIPTNISNTDSIVFTFNYAGDPTKLQCLTSPFSASTIFKQSLVCVTGSTCDISVITGNKTLPVFTYKSYLSFNNANSTSVPTSTGEVVSVNFDIVNGGEAIQAGTPTTISYFSDTNGNGIYDITDTYISQNTFTNSILNNSTYSYSASINVPGGKACKLIALLDTSINHCSCTPTQIALTPTLNLTLANNALCTSKTGTIGILSTTNYTYTWTPNTFLSSTSVSSPVASPINSTSLITTYTYSLTIDRGGCLVKGIATLTVYPSPVITSSSATICVGQQTAALIAMGAATYTWNTGETTAINNQSPLIITDYTVTGTDINGCVNTGTANVFVNSLPILSTTNATICLGQQTATLTVSGATTYTWNTGQNGSVVTKTPAINTTYTVIGTDANACYSSSTSSVLVNPLPIITVNSATICLGQQTATLNANGASTYTWSTLETTSTVTQTPNVTTTYTVLGTNTNGCIGAQTTTVVVNSLPIVTINNPSICKGQTATLTATGASTYSWSTNQTTAAIAQSPTVTTSYSVVGTDGNNCYSSATATITVYKNPTVAFISDSACLKSPSNLVDASNGNGSPLTNYAWDFTNDNIADATGANTSYTFSISGNNAVNYTVSSSPTASLTCKSFTTQNVWVRTLPTANFSVTAVCQSLANVFTNMSSTPSGTITNWQWDYTNNGSYDNTTRNPTFVYPASGTYTALLTIKSNYGCKDSVVKTVTVYGHAKPTFTANPVCFTTSTSFTNNSTTSTNPNTGSITNWNWTFGDASTSTIQSPLHNYSTTTNATSNTTYTVKLVVNTNNNCKDSISQSVIVYSKPTAAFKADSICFNKATQLTDASNGNGNPLTNYNWDFTNDNNADATGSPTSYTLALAGNNSVNYTVTTTPIFGLSCSSFTTQNAWVNPLPQPAFVFTYNCVNAQPTNFDAFGSVISAGTNSVYSWAFADGQTNTLNTALTSHSYNNAGLYTVTLTVTSNKGCTKKVTTQIEVYAKPVVSISASSGVCIGSATTFTATTKTQSGTITNWQWDLNNFIPSIEATGQNGSYTFGSAGSHTLTLLTITDRFCRDTSRLAVYINYYPAPQFTIDVPSGCEKHCVTFTDGTANIPTPSKITNWNWNFGNGTIINSSTKANQVVCFDNPNISQPAIFSPTLTTKTDSGCVSSISYANMISVYPKPVANFVLSPDSPSVINPQVYFNNQSVGYTKWYWSYGDGSKIDSINRNPLHNYNTESPKVYEVKLIVSNQYGCMDTTSRVVEIRQGFVFYIPNSFSPNEDGTNELFTGVGIGITKYEMWLYDRWGEQIYFTDDIKKGWNGKVQGKDLDCKQDVYVWKVQLKDVFDKKHSYVGHVTLLR